MTALLLSGASVVTGSANSKTNETTSQQSALHFERSVIHRWISTAHHWQLVLGKHPTRASRLVDNTPSLQYLRWSLRHWKTLSRRNHQQAKRLMVQRTRLYENSIDRMKLSMGLHVQDRRLTSAGSVEARYNQTRRLYRSTLSDYHHPPFLSQFECIHGYEGSWTDGGAPYWGGVQFGYEEWLRFGYPYTHKSYANLATKWDQLWAAARYHAISGFSPWPYTARDCGLL